MSFKYTELYEVLLHNFMYNNGSGFSILLKNAVLFLDEDDFKELSIGNGKIEDFNYAVRGDLIQAAELAIEQGLSELDCNTFKR